MSCVHASSGQYVEQYQDFYKYKKKDVRSCDNPVHDIRMLLVCLYEFVSETQFPKFKVWINDFFERLLKTGYGIRLKRHFENQERKKRPLFHAMYSSQIGWKRIPMFEAEYIIQDMANPHKDETIVRI